MIASWVGWWIGAYFVGSIPAGFLLARSRGVDIRQHGSGNIGATNVWRVFGPRLGALCFAIDVLKGLLPTLAAGWAHGVLAERPGAAVAYAWMGVAAAAIGGHMFPVWLRFKGGKGVATGLGALLGVWPVMTAAAGVALAVWIVSAKVTRYVGVSSCLAALAMPVGVVAAGRLLGDGAGVLERVAPYLVVSALLAALVVYKHRANIRRTLQGTESRIGQRVTAGGGAGATAPSSRG
jgi:glycerol-3-phosphate acyltransferase PlsY